MENTTRVGLRVWVRCDDGALRFHPLHLGLFPEHIAEQVAHSVEAAGIAYHLRFAGQTGTADVTLTAGGEERAVRTVHYEAFLTVDVVTAPEGPAFDENLVRIDRHRLSVTQGEVSLHYGDTRLERFGDEVILYGVAEGCGSPWGGTSPGSPEEGAVPIAGYAGRGDKFWIDVARRMVMQAKPTEA